MMMRRKQTAGRLGKNSEPPEEPPEDLGPAWSARLASISVGLETLHPCTRSPFHLVQRAALSDETTRRKAKAKCKTAKAKVDNEAINKEIVSCESAESLLALCGAKVDDFDVVNISTAIRCLSGMKPPRTDDRLHRLIGAATLSLRKYPEL